MNSIKKRGSYLVLLAVAAVLAIVTCRPRYDAKGDDPEQ